MGASAGRNRPLGVTIIGILLLILGLLILLASIAVGSLEGLEGLKLGIQLAILVIGVIYVILAFGFLKGWAWIWTLTMVFLLLGIILDLASWAIGGAGLGSLISTIIGMVLPILIVLYMNTEGVRRFFGK